MFQKLAGRRPELIDKDRYRRYSVLAPFLPDTKEFLFQVRSPKLNRQPGEICFPGGFIEAGESPLEAAVRETSEELLLQKEHIDVVAPLDILVNASNSLIYPFLGKLYDYPGTFNRDEVAEVFSVPFQFFLENPPEVYYNKIEVTPGEDFPYHLLGTDAYPWAHTTYPVLFYKFKSRVIWGMTAKFVQNIVELYQN